MLDKITSANLQPEDLFLSEKDFFELIIEKLEVEKLDFEEEKQLIDQIKELLILKATKSDKSFFPAIEAEISKTHKGVSDLGKRLNKALETRHETEINKLQNLRKKLFPNGELQERSDNFLNFYINHPNLIQILHQNFNPFVFEMECVVL